MKRHILEPLGEVRPGGINAPQIARMVRLIVAREGRMLVSMDTDGKVYATPIEHPFSHSMLRQYADRIVATYSPLVTVDEIKADLVAQWRNDRQVAA